MYNVFFGSQSNIAGSGSKSVQAFPLTETCKRLFRVALHNRFLESDLIAFIREKHLSHSAFETGITLPAMASVARFGNIALVRNR